MFKPSKAATVAEYIAAVEEPKRSELKKLHALIKKMLPSLRCEIGSGMIGYGKYHYRYPSGREGDCYRVAMASNKTGISVYVNAVDDRGYIAEQAKSRLGKASVGKSCIRFRKLEDLELPGLTDVLRRVSKAPGLGEVIQATSAKRGAKTTRKAATRTTKPARRAATKKIPAKRRPAKR
jgi:hypothetical protein